MVAESPPVNTGKRPTDVAKNVRKETIRVYEEGVSHRNTNKSLYPRREVDVPVPKLVVAICKK